MNAIMSLDRLYFTYNLPLSNLQESHQEGVGEDEFLFAEGELNVNKLFVLVDFYNGSLAEFLVYDGAVNSN